MATHDYVIDNSTGANVRSDLNNVLQAILTNNSSSSAPSTTAAYMWWADTTNGVLKIRNSANDGWVELFQLDGTITLEDGNATTPGLAFRDDLNTGIFSSSADTFCVATGGVERMELGTSETSFNEDGLDVNFRIESDNKTHMFFIDAGNDRIGINESAPSTTLHVAGADGSTIAYFDTDLGGRGLKINTFTSGSAASAGVEFEAPAGAAKSAFVFKGASEFCRLDTSGRLLIGLTSSATTDSNAHSKLQAVTTAGPNVFLGRDDSDTADNSRLGVINFGGNHGGTYHEIVTIRAAADAQHASNSKASRLELYTTSTGNTTGTERMRIDSSGKVGIGTSSPSVTLHVSGGDGLLVERSSGTSIAGFKHSGASAMNIYFQNSGSTNHPSIGSDNEHLTFGTGNSERMRILNDGAVVINATARPVVGTEKFGVQGGSASNTVGIGAAVSHEDGIPFFASNGSATSGQRLMRFAAGSGGDTRGTITFNGSAMVYGGTSDYRLKENMKQISDGISKLKNLNPINFNWIKDEKNTNIMGFLAHEVQQVMPEAVSGTKDGVDSEGKEDYQEMDYGRITPLLTAALQEAITKIEVLETKVAALEAA